MSTTTTGTTYTINVGSSAFGEIITMTFNGTTDTEALNLAMNFKNYPWPAAFGSVSVQAYRDDGSNTQYNGNLTASPATFT